MKKRNDSPKSDRRSRSSEPDRTGKNSPRSSSNRPERSNSPRSRFGEPGSSGPFKPKGKNTEKLFNKPTIKKSDLEKLAFDSSTGKKIFGNDRGPRREDRDFDKPRGEFRPHREEGGSDRPPRRFDRDERGSDKPRGEFRPRREEGGSDRPPRRFDRDERNDAPRGPRREDRGFDKPRGERPRRDEGGSEFGSRNKRTSNPDNTNDGESRRVGRFSKPPRYDFSDYEDKRPSFKKQTDDDVLRLNRYIANAGICSRREADELIESGQITVNGEVVTEMGYKVKRSDTVKYGKNVLNPERMVYLLINKPKDYITTTDDPEERRTVMDLIAGACEERIYPVGRLDRNTTGLLLLTNDGELAKKLTHPSSNVRKIYQAELDRPITTEDFEAMQAGFELEDGFIRPDEIGIVTPDALVVGLEIHSGKNRIVRRMFEHFGYEVKKLDRTVFAGLNKKELPRGKWRFLTEKEVIKLKFLI